MRAVMLIDSSLSAVGVMYGTAQFKVDTRI